MTLQEEAEKLISTVGIVDKLSQFGETHIVGNVAFGTTTKRDIDIQIYCDLHYEDAAVEIIRALTKIGLADIRERRLKKSNKYLILAKYKDWDIDITITQPSTNYLKDSYQFYLDYHPKVTPERLELIMKFKEKFAHNKISGDNSSYYIYLGVLDKGISTCADMEKFLNRMKGNK